LLLKNLPQGAPYVATSNIKWNRAYQQKIGVSTEPAKLTPEQTTELVHLSKRIYRFLNLSGYARMDFRLTEQGNFYLLEANPNPDISSAEDFAQAAKHSNVSYHKLLQRIINLGLSYQPFNY
jgi:D-alanine-D-alanine ligase